MAVKTKEQQVAELLEKFNGLFEGDDSLPTTISRVKVLQEEFKELKGLNLTTVVQEVEKIRAGQEKLIKQIRSSKRGFYVPGIEDEEFSMLKAFIGIKTGKWKGCEREHEILNAVRSKRSEVLAKAAAGSQNVGDDELGGYFVPDQVIPDVIAAIYTRSVFINLSGEGTTRVSVLEGLIGGNVKVPKFDGGLIAYWIGEEDAYAESQVSVGDMTMNPKKLGILVRLTDAMRRFQSYGFENLLRQDLIRAAAKKLDWTIAYGRGTDDMPKGIVHHQGIKIFSAEQGKIYTQAQVAAGSSPLDDWDGGELGFDGLMDMELALEEDDISLDDSHTWISSPRFFHELKQMKIETTENQTDQFMYLMGAPYIPDSRLSGIIGPFDKSTQIPSDNLPGESVDGATDSTAEKYTDVFGGNLSNVVLGRWSGIEIEDDDGKGAGFTSDHTYLKLRMYADVGIRQERAIIVCPDAKVRS
jgi:HK97 family phage major capsid protein